MSEVTIPLRSHEEAILVLGPYDRHAKLLRQALDIEIFTRRGNLRLKGGDENVIEARARIEHLLGKIRKGRQLGPREAEAILMPRSGEEPKPDRRDGSTVEAGETSSGGGVGSRSARVRFRSRAFEPRGDRQRKYLDLIQRNSLILALGVAGTGKTFLAVAAAVRALREGECRRLVMTRPVVEAGEHLGFLPGDLQAKLNPYTRPIYDALAELLEFEDIQRLEEKGVIEVAPLAYMRGRTLADSFVILDEAQNTTVSQMKMFLTRMGEGSRMVVTGDPTQVDLDHGVRSGLADAVARLKGFASVGVVEFGVQDICRHPLVEQIVRAYEGPGRASRDRREKRPVEEA